MEEHGREPRPSWLGAPGPVPGLPGHVAHSASCDVTRGGPCDCPAREVRRQTQGDTMDTRTPAERNQRAKVRMDPRTIAMMLDLPEGLHVAHVYAETDPYGIVVVVEGASLEPQPPDCALPELGGTFTRTTSHHADKTWMRWGWMR